MHLISRNGLAAFQFPLLNTIPGIQHGLFLRHAGAGGPQAEFNLGLRCGAPDALVWRNRRRARTFFGPGTMVFARQTHGARVAVWSAQEIAAFPPGRDSVDLEGDAIVTDVSDQLLFIQVADCQAVIIVDPRRRVVANIHSGWRGTVQNIAGRTVDLMIRRFACRPRDLMCAIGPSLGPCCAEFIHYRDEIPREYWDYGDRRSHFDFWRITADQLIAGGIAPQHISPSNICTRCNAHLFYSYRAARDSGRFAAVVVLRSD